MASHSDETSALLPRPFGTPVMRSHSVPEQSSLSASSAHKLRDRSSSSRFVCSGLVVNRVLILLLLAAIVGVSLFFERQVSDLSAQLSAERNRIDKLDQVIGLQETVIERFNSSVTNTDVLTRLSLLEKNFTATAKNVEHDLMHVQRVVGDQLNATLDILSATVEQAERDIGNEVDKVKADVEQYVVTTQAQFSMENSFMVYQLAGTFTLLSCLISMWHMSAHLRKMNQPSVQKRILAILWMSPLYAVTSWFSLVFPQAEGYLAIIKDGYEAYIIYQFLAFCIAVLGKGNRSAVVDLLARHADHLTPPFRLFGCFEICGCCVPEPYENNRALADAILLQCQVFALQFVFFRPVTTTGMVVLGKLEYYGAGDSPKDWRSPQFWLTIVQNISIFVAFTGLLKFYHAVDSDLAWCRPFAKFLCIKGVVFMTFWQGLAISVLAETTDFGGEDAEGWAKSAQNFLICLEMLLFSIAHFYCFPTEEWEEGYRVKHSRGQFGDSIALGDFFDDLKVILKSSNQVKKKKKPTQPTIPEADVEDGGSQGDLTAALSVATSGDEFDEDEAVKRALEKSLGAVSDDPDIIEAKRRLLESKVLSPDFFECGDNSSVGSFGSGDEEETEHSALGDSSENHAEEEKIEEGLAHNEAQRVEDEDESDEGSEASPLLEHNGSSFAEMLRPSIFTTVASIATSEKEARKREKQTRKQA